MKRALLLAVVCMVSAVVTGCAAAPMSSGKYLVIGTSFYEDRKPQLVQSYGSDSLVVLVRNECAHRYPALFTMNVRNAFPIIFWAHDETTVSELADKIAAEVAKLDPATLRNGQPVTVLKDAADMQAPAGTSSTPPALPSPANGTTPY